MTSDPTQDRNDDAPHSHGVAQSHAWYILAMGVLPTTCFATMLENAALFRLPTFARHTDTLDYLCGSFAHHSLLSKVHTSLVSNVQYIYIILFAIHVICTMQFKLVDET